jgi:hypothetical protein
MSDIRIATTTIEHMEKLLKIVRSGFRFGVVPLVLMLLGTIVMFALTLITDGSLAQAPFSPQTALAVLVVLAFFCVMLSLAGIAFALSLQLAQRIGGKMPEGAVAIALGMLFSVVLASAVPLLRETAASFGCAQDGTVWQAICATNTAIAGSEQIASVWSTFTAILLGYAAVTGLVIGGMVAESRGITVMREAAPQAIPVHLTRKPAMTRDQWLKKFREEDSVS